MLMKTNVLLDGVSDEMWLGALKVDAVYRRLFGGEVVITSAKDGTHGENSLHYSGNAMDFRTRDIQPALRAYFASVVAAKLKGEFDVVLEHDHLHVEYDPDER